MSELVCKTLELLAETKGGFASAVKNIFNTRTMATLKTSDLSVGNWVQDNYGNYVKVVGIWQGSNFSYQVDCLRDGKSVTITPCNLHPIPITAEILEKNGLVRHERDAYNPKSIVLSNHFIMARTYTDVDWWRVLIYDEELPSLELFNGRIYSVHLLQHALKLAGVDKEINL